MNERYALSWLAGLACFFGALLFAAGLVMPNNQMIIGILGTLATGAASSLYTHLKQTQPDTSLETRSNGGTTTTTTKDSLISGRAG